MRTQLLHLKLGPEASFNVSRPLLKHVVKAHDFHGSAGMHGRWRLQATKNIAPCVTPKAS